MMKGQGDAMAGSGADHRTARRTRPAWWRTGFGVAALSVLVGLAPAQVPGPSLDRRPRLIVYLVVDQFRADYVERYGHQWTAGLKRLFEHGAVFPRAAYPFWNTVTCAGHATLATGAFPATHGMVLNNWYDRDAGRLMNCIEDPRASFVSYARPANGGAGPYRLLIPTLSDELRAQLGTRPRIVSLAGKPRSAIMMAGQRADVVAWTEDPAEGFVTSSPYAAAPVPVVQRFVGANLLEKDFGRMWTPHLRPDQLLYDNDPLGRTPNEGLGPLFPHTLTTAAQPDQVFYVNWADTPFIDDYMGRMAVSIVEELQMGRGPGTDYLALSFSAVDRVGHMFGPFSHELQDALARVDVRLGELLADLDRLVGPEEYVLALSSDHGVAPIPEQMAAKGFEAGRLTGGRIGRVISEALRPLFGEERMVMSVQYSQAYLADGVYERLKAQPEAMTAALTALGKLPGVKSVYRNDELDSEALRQDPVARAVRLSYFPGRSGELTIVPKPYWIMSNEAATHGTGYDYDTRVPLVLAGKGIRPGLYLEPVTPADIAPTLAFLTGITLARPDGRVLVEALSRSPGPASRSIDRP